MLRINKMNLQDRIRRIIREEVKLSSSFKRRISKFEEIIKNSYAMRNPCDFEDFTQFMMGIHHIRKVRFIQRKMTNLTIAIKQNKKVAMSNYA